MTTKLLKKQFILFFTIVAIIFIAIGFTSTMVNKNKTISSNLIQRTITLESKTVSNNINLTTQDVKYISQLYDMYVKENFNASEDEINAYLQNEITKISSSKQIDNVNYIIFGKDLTGAEILLFSTHPIISLEMYNCSETAKNKTIEFFGSSNVDDNSDAFRHGYWNALMTKKRDASWAEKFATAHEEGKSDLSTEMDFANNSTGRFYGEAFSNLSDDELAYTILDRVLSGRFERIVNNSLVGTNYEGVLPQFGIQSTVISSTSVRIDNILFNIVGDYTIPSIIDGKNVTEIGDEAFCSMYDAYSFSIPGSVTSIGESSFMDCTYLTMVNFDQDSALTHIGDYAFYGSALALFYIPDNVVSIGFCAFSNCLNSLALGGGSALTNIDHSAFSGTKLLNSTVPVSVTNIGSYAFDSCDLQQFAFSTGSQLNTIGNYAFKNNAQLFSIVIPNSITNIGQDIFNSCSSLTIYTEQLSCPSTWNANWNSSNRPVFWNCTLSSESSDKPYVFSFTKSTLSPSSSNGISDPYRKGYNFEGWSITSGGAAVYTMDNIINAPNGTVLYAIWTEKTSCLSNSSLITLSDGTQKAVELLTGNEQLLVWNLLTGQFDTAPILFIDSDPQQIYEVINLYFSDGITVKVIFEHGFWNINLNKYVFLRDDAAQYIGHWFNKQTTDADGNMTWIAVQLTDVVIANEITTAWSPITYGYLCYYVNGMLSMPGATTGLINIFDVDAETMTINMESYLADIEEYGLFTYEEFDELLPVPEIIFEAFGGQYLKVSIGKGLITQEEIARLIASYDKFF